VVLPDAQSRDSRGVRAQGFIQLGLEKFQGWSLHNLSGHPAPLLACPDGEVSQQGSVGCWKVIKCLQK